MSQPRMGGRAIFTLLVSMIAIGVVIHLFRDELGAEFNSNDETRHPTLRDSATSGGATSSTGAVRDDARATVQKQREVEAVVDRAVFNGVLRVVVTDHRGRAVAGATIWTISQLATSFPKRQDLDSELLCDQIASSKETTDSGG